MCNGGGKFGITPADMTMTLERVKAYTSTPIPHRPRIPRIDKHLDS